MSGGHPATSSLAAFVLLAVQTVLRVGLWPLYFAERTFKHLRKPQSYNLDPRRIFCLPIASRSNSEGPRIAFMATGFVEVRVAKEITQILPGPANVTFAALSPLTLETLRVSNDPVDVTPFPFDTLLSCAAWLWQVRPQVIVLQEQARRPSLACLARIMGIRLVLINGRIRKGTGWHRNLVFGLYSAIGLEAATVAEELKRSLPSVRIEVTGIAKPSVTDPGGKKRREIDAWLGGSARPIVAAGSVENVEEGMFVLTAFDYLRHRTDATLLLAPRRMGTIEPLIEAAQTAGWSLSRRTEGTTGRDIDILLLDTVGELSYAYGGCVAAFVGGTLCGMGHNVVEPLAWGIGLAYGDNPGSSHSCQESCSREGVGKEIECPQALACHWESFIVDEELRKAQSVRAATYMANFDQALTAAARLVQENL